MTIIESELKNIEAPATTVYQFLADLNNHQELMPDQVINWTSSADECSFTIQGTGNLSLKTSEKETDRLIRLVPAGKVPFNFDLVWHITDAEGKSTVKAVINADLNMFMKMLASGPLQNLINFQTDKLQKKFNG